MIERFGLVLCLALLVASLAAGCQDSDAPRDAESRGEAPAQPQDDPYLREDVPYPYNSTVQRKIVNAYLACMEREGVPLRGPFVDHENSGMVFKPKGKPAPLATLRAAGDRCPQNMLAIFLDGAGDDADMAIFRRASIEFASCMRTHGVPNFPVPQFGQKNPYAEIEDLKIDWNSSSFAKRVSRCRKPLEAVFFS